MLKSLLIAAALLAATPALSSEWMGSLSFTKGAPPGVASASWKASLRNGTGTMKVKGTSLRYDVQKSNSFFVVSDKKGGGIVGTGVVHKGHVIGTFKVGNTLAGNFQGDRTSKGGKGKK